MEANELIISKKRRYIGDISPAWETPIVIEHARDEFLVDSNGHVYIDFTSGWNITNFGWSNRTIEAAVREQEERLHFAPLWCITRESVDLAQELASILPAPLDVCYRCVTGTDAIECALKIARKYTGKKQFISFGHAFHGQTLGALSLANSSERRHPYTPLLEDSLVLEHPFISSRQKGISLDQASQEMLKEIESIMTGGNVASVIAECLTTVPGVFPVADFFFHDLSSLCQQYGTLLTIDEIGTGFGRTGRNFAFEHFNIIPDIVCVGKALSGGFAPIASAITSANIAQGNYHTTSYGWTPTSCAAAISAIRFLKGMDFVDVNYKATYITKHLQECATNSSIIKEIRGLGLEIGVEISAPGYSEEENFALLDDIVEDCITRGVFVVSADRVLPVLVLFPPLTISMDSLKKGVDVIIDVLQTISKKSLA